MRRGKNNIMRYLLWGALAAAAILIAVFFAPHSSPSDVVKAAQRTGKALEKRMETLDSHINTALAENNVWIGSLGVPDDMVVYRYIEDSLQSWCNQFPVKNDDITGKVVIQRLSRPRENISSPRAESGEDPMFVNYGTKWYLVKSKSSGPVKVIAGLEIMDTMDEENSSGINPRISTGRGFTIVPLSENGGSLVTLGEIPVFKVISESITGQGTLARAALFSKLFSPTIYADGKYFNSLGAIIIFSLVVFLGVLTFFLFRKRVLRRIMDKKRWKALLGAHTILLFLLLAGIVIFIHLIFKSVILNSSISLELYRLNDLSVYSLLVYVTLILLLMTIPLLGVMISPPLRKLTGVRIDLLSGTARIITAVMFAAYLVTMVGILGFKKEKDRVNVLANRLSMERNISLELQLRLVEEKIASDQLISSLASLSNSNSIIQNRIVESYMVGLSQDNDIIVELFPENEKNPAAISYFTSMVTSGTVIADGTRFRYHRDAGGNSSPKLQRFRSSKGGRPWIQLN